RRRLAHGGKRPPSCRYLTFISLVYRRAPRAHLPSPPSKENTMPNVDTIPKPDVQIAITLASLAYLAENDPPAQMRKAIVSHLEQPDLPTGNQWKVVWGPAVYEPNMWYIASGPNSLGPASLALVIRGTNMTSLKAIRQDAELTLVPFDDPNR